MLCCPRLPAASSKAEQPEILHGRSLAPARKRNKPTSPRVQTLQDVFDWARQVINARATDKTMAAVPGAATPALTNVYLPGISGHEAIHLFIQHFPKVPV